MSERKNLKIDVVHHGRVLEVPLVFERNDLIAAHGDIPAEVRLDRIFSYEDELHAEHHGNPSVALAYIPRELPFVDEAGWAAGELDSGRVWTSKNPGETLWVRDDD